MPVTPHLLTLYRQTFGYEPSSVQDMRPDGSDRKLYRFTAPDGKTVVGVYGPDVEENKAFLSYSRSFKSIGLPVPEIYAADEANGVYLEEDLGDTTLFDVLNRERTGTEFPATMEPIYRTVLETLPRFQVHGGEVVDYSVAYPRAEFDGRSILWDLNYFKYHYLKLAHIPFHEERLERDFEKLTEFLLQADRTHFLYRDFQSRNIMLRGSSLEASAPWFIDYQGGRKGALQYDVASLLYDAKAVIPTELRSSLLYHYMDALENYAQFDRERFIEHYRGYVLVRIMQAMGAYGYRGYFEGKPHFIASIPYAVENISEILSQGLPIQLPELERVFGNIIEGAESARKHSGDQQNTTQQTESPSTLTVHITSFSYKKGGYPQDTTGHGGGFVFDCRAIHNPGRYPEYKGLTGQNQPVIEFLEKEEQTEPFWNGLVPLVSNAVETYIKRGFEHLSVGFGCTGGQHRSVYFAERLARYLQEKYPVTVMLHHREEGTWPENQQAEEK